MRRSGGSIGIVVAAMLPLAVQAVTPGFVDSFATGGTNEWGNGSGGVSNPGTGGVDGEGDGYLKIAQSAASNFGARSFNTAYTGDWVAAGITEISLWLNDVGAPQAFEIHVLISDSFGPTTYQYAEGFHPPSNCWEHYHVDLTDSSKWVQTRGDATFEQVLSDVSRVTIRHDLAPYIDSPNGIAGDLGMDHFALEPAASSCASPGADVDDDGDVDQADFGAFQACFTGECTARPASCACLDADGDGHVGMGDLAVFLGCVSGPGISADPTCAGG